MSKLEACPRCASARAEGDFEQAARCFSCEGRGYRRPPESYKCNRCALSLCTGDDTHNADTPYGLIDAVVDGGYDSPHLTEGTTYTFSLCEACLRWLFGQEFRMKPRVSGALSTETYEEDEAEYWTRMWYARKGHIEKLVTGICNFDEKCTAPAVKRHFVSGHMTGESYCTEHAKGGAINSTWVDEKLIRGIPLEEDLRSDTDKERLAEAWLSEVTSRAEGKPVRFKFLSACVLDCIKSESDEMGGFWIPNALKTPEWLKAAVDNKRLWEQTLSSGLLYFAPYASVEILAADNVRPNDFYAPI